MKAKLNTDLFPIINVGMYESDLSPENVLSTDCINDDKEQGYILYNEEYFWDNFDNDLYTKEVQREAAAILDGKHKINDFEITIKCGDIYSPKYYNFTTDNVDMEVTYNKAEVLKLAKKETELFNSFLKENYSSCDGFTSFGENNFNDWLKKYKNDCEIAVGAILTYLCGDYFENSNADLLDSFYSNHTYSDFVDLAELNKERDAVIKYVQDNYIDFNIETEYGDDYFEHLDSFAVSKIAKDTVDSIESHTIEIIF
jgi:hypothetical protein